MYISTKLNLIHDRPFHTKASTTGFIIWIFLQPKLKHLDLCISPFLGENYIAVDGK